MIFWYIILFLLALPAAVFLISIFIGIPCLPTHKKQAQVLIDLCELKPGMKLVDLGSGHGRLVMLAAEKGANAVGYELNPLLVLLSRWLIKKRGLSANAVVYWRSLFKADVDDVDVVTTFLFQHYMDRLENGLFKDLKSGAKVVSYTFPVKGWTPVVNKEAITVYRKNIDF